MEELLEREIRDLREQQAQMEEKLMALDAASRGPCSGGLIDVNTLQSAVPTIATTRDATSAANAAFDVLSVETRLEQLEEMRRRQQRAANRALRNYFTAVSDYPSYQATRERRLQEARSFSFETRELQRSQRIRTRRREEEEQRRRREEEEQFCGEESRRFRASPVPPSTYMNKYALMVEEWRQRRAAVEEFALAKAERLREAAAYRQITAECLRQTRQVMGVRRSEKPKRAQSAAGAETAENRRRVVELWEIPLEVKMKLWPALEEHQQFRNVRIKQRAAERLKEVQEEESHRVALLESAQQQEPQFGIKFTALQQQLEPLPPPVVPVGGPIVAPSTVQGVVPQMTGVAISPTIPTTAPTTIVPVSTTPGAPGITIGGAVPSQPYLSTPSATTNINGTAAVVTAKKQTEGTQSKSKNPSPTDAAKYNKNLTFKPKIRGGVPNFSALWAEERLSLAERKRRQQPTCVQPFNITTSEKDTVLRGRPAVLSKRTTSSTSTHRRCRSAASATQPPRSVSRHGEKDEKSKNILPKGTRAHAMRTQAVFSKYIISSEAKVPGEPEREELKALQEAYRRQKIVNARLKEYLKNSRCNADAVIKAKVRALRQRSREMEREAAERLEEMRIRVAQMPPIFVEPTHLHDIAKARAETEKEIMQMLKESGLDGTTLTAILGGGAGNDDAATLDTINKVETEGEKSATVETKKDESLLKQGDEESLKKETEKKSNDSSTSESETDSSSESDSESASESDTSSSATTIGKSKPEESKTGGQYDDDFESSSTSS